MFLSFWLFRCCQSTRNNLQSRGHSNFSLARLYEIISDRYSEYFTDLADIDPVATVFEYYLEKARIAIEKATGVDIFEDEKYSKVQNIYANCIDTHILLGDDETKEALLELIGKIENKSDVINWLISEIE